MKSLLVLLLLACSLINHALAEDSLMIREEIKDGAAFNVGIFFSPHLVAGNSFVLSVNGKKVLTGNLARGSMANLSANVIGDTSSTSIELMINSSGGTRQATRTVQIKQPGAVLPPVAWAFSSDSVNTSLRGQYFHLLFSQYSPPFFGQMTLSDADFLLNLASEGGLSKRNAFGISGSISNQIELTFGQGASFRTQDDPKVFGRSARGG